jgi:hypothetical protein
VLQSFVDFRLHNTTLAALINALPGLLIFEQKK